MRHQFAPLVPERATLQFSDPVEFSRAIPGVQFECLPWQGEAFDTRVELLRLAGLNLRTTDSAAHISRATLEPGTTTLFMQTQQGEAGVRFNGVVMPLHAVGIAAGGTDLTLVAERRVGAIILQLPFDLIAGLPDGRSMQLADGAGLWFLDGPFRAHRRLAEELRAAAEMLGDPWGPALAQEHVEGLALSLREQMAEALAAEAGPMIQQRAMREAVRIVRQVDDLLFSRLSEPIYTAQLCDALQVSPRKLHDATIAICGMSPHGYLKLRRLTLARRALGMAAPGAKLVKRVALAHGFWHFGNFSHDYRDLFGETPTQTLSRARGPAAASDHHKAP